MTVNIHPDTLNSLISQAKFSVHGDEQERKYGDLIAKNFPNCEKFWQLFVVPLTKRILDTDGNLGKNTGFRNEVDNELRQNASAHYSVFMHLMFAHQHVENLGSSWFENFYARLGTVCDLAETVLERWHILRLQCHGRHSKVLQKLTRDEFLDLAGKAYDKDYSNAYQHYLSKGKFMSIKVPQGDNLLKEYLGNAIERKEYAQLSQQIRTYRNVMVHDIKLGRVFTKDSVFIPKLSKVGKYRTWKAVEDASNNLDTFQQDFIEQMVQVRNTLAEIEKCLNILWTKLIQDVSEELYSSDRDLFRQLAGINFTPDSGIRFVINSSADPNEEPPYSSASGAYPPSGVILQKFTSDNSTDTTINIASIDDEELKNKYINLETLCPSKNQNSTPPSGKAATNCAAGWTHPSTK